MANNSGLAPSVRAEPLRDVAHLGRVEVLTPRPQESLWYFRDVLGMDAVHSAGDSIYLRGYGDYAAATLKLTSAETSGVGCISLRAASPEALERRAEAIDRRGLGEGWTNGDYGHGRSYRFRDPDSHRMEIYYEESRYEPPPGMRSALKNLPQKYTARGVGVRRLDHLALLAREVAPNRAFAEETLGFQLREQVRFNGGALELGSWLSTNALHHQLAYVLDVRGGSGRVHHLSFWVDNREDVLRAADILRENGVFIEAGPAKHNNSQGFYLYSYEPGGNRIEIYSGSFLVLAPDWQPVTWNEEERGTGVYWGGALPESFIQYATPPLDAPVGVGPPTPAFDPN
jgi:catechol 2,3-dioxygenase